MEQRRNQWRARSYCDQHSLSGFSPGTYPNTVSAGFPTDGSYNSSSGTGTLTVTKATPTVALTSSVNPSNLGQSVTFTATVSSTAGTPTGTVQFKDNGSAIGGPLTLNAGVAQFSTSALTAGAHTITADYGGDTNFQSGAGTLAGGQQVRPSLSI